MNASSAILEIQNIQRAFSILSTLQLTSFLFPQQAHVHDGSRFDFIVCGAGSAGSVIANRLTEIKDATVLLIEAGGDPPVESVIPGLFLYLKNTSVDWNFKSEDDGYSQQFHKNHGAEVTRGKMLGGSSSINYMLYTRGDPHDFDGWANITGDKSWTWQKTLPYFKKSERLVDPLLLKHDAGRYHGTDGYLGTTKNYHKEVLKYFEAFKEAGNKIVMDITDKTHLGYTEGIFTIADYVHGMVAEKEKRRLYTVVVNLMRNLISTGVGDFEIRYSFRQKC
ncbi:hypothetical protein PYW08_005396 [Mythimna loreyi]|uniref:Uncharacterized protein n=1 Tax=Mythimna loreyi TaxID=667449 RepID=A0ACC2QJ58_9NEOP|nr:hypothetical protein PYW08_005396 [Mythimna loreyi]